MVVFDRDGHFARRWGRQGTVAEVQAGVGGVFLNMEHSVIIGKDGLVYVCDRQGDRIEVFDKMGGCKRSLLVKGSWGAPPYIQPGGTCDLDLSPNAQQEYAYVAECTNGQIHTRDRVTGETLANYGRPGQAAGDICWPVDLDSEIKWE